MVAKKKLWYDMVMHKKHKYDLIVLLAMLGFGISVYLATSELLGFSVPCGITGGCDQVLNSKYSKLFGVPVAFFGVLYFFGLVFFSLLANYYAKAKKMLTLMLSVGALGALVFLYIQFFIIRQICQYCFATDVLAVILLLLDLNIEHKSA